MSTRKELLRRTAAFSQRFGLDKPILLAPMAGACPPELSIEVSKAGGMGGCGVLLMAPGSIRDWVNEFRNAGGKEFQLNNWIPDPQPIRSAAQEDAVVQFLRNWHPEVSSKADLAKSPDFHAQCEAMLEARPTSVSSIMGLYSDEFSDRMKACGIAWFATVTSVAEAEEAQARGADVIVAQGVEAGGHRGTFDAEQAESVMAGLFSLLPALVDNVDLPVVATGGIADARGIAAAIVLGASAVQIGTGFLRCPESGIPDAWTDAIGSAKPEDTILTRAFTGRPGRSFKTDYAVAANAPEAPMPAPYPVQRALTAPMTAKARKENDLQRMQAWSGQSGHLAKSWRAFDLTNALWSEACELLFDGVESA